MADKFVIPKSDLSAFVHNLCLLGLGIIRMAHPTVGRAQISGSASYSLLVPVCRLLRALLDRATRISGLVDPEAWLLNFPIIDTKILKRKEMIGMDENVQYSQVQQNFYGASSYDKQLMTLFALMPFTGIDFKISSVKILAYCRRSSFGNVSINLILGIYSQILV